MAEEILGQLFCVWAGLALDALLIEDVIWFNVDRGECARCVRDALLLHVVLFALMMMMVMMMMTMMVIRAGMMVRMMFRMMMMMMVMMMMMLCEVLMA